MDRKRHPSGRPIAQRYRPKPLSIPRKFEALLRDEHKTLDLIGFGMDHAAPADDEDDDYGKAQHRR